jgi:long-chain acyl-CoA synthetase
MPDPAGSDTIVSLFCSQVARTPSQPALHVRRGIDFVPLTWSQVADDVRRAAAGLIHLGVARGDRVILVSPNRYEWIIADLAIQMAQAVHVPVHASLAGKQIIHQIVDSGAKVVIVSGEEQTEKLLTDGRELLPKLKILAFDPCPETWEQLPLRRWAEISAGIDNAAAERVQREALAHVRPDDLATVLYTSGTTGEPKGVMLSQRNLASNAVASLTAFGQRPDDFRLGWLPLSHIFARTCDLYTWIAAGSQLALADSPETVLTNCGQVRPTLLNGVPYFYEKVQRQLMEDGKVSSPSAMAEVFGGRLRAAISGGAPLPKHVAEFYHRQGVKLLQGYGLTETSPVISTETVDHHKLGTVGRPIPGVEVRISSEGEILTRGPHVMAGYWNNQAATDESIVDGWFHTGDLGAVDAEGFLRITGRKKELIVTAGGKNVAPAHIEALLSEDPLVKQVCVVGDGRNFLTALIVPDAAELGATLEAQRIAVSGREALADPRVRRLFSELIDRRLTVVSRYEQVRNFILLPEEFSIERGELTPTLKLRRPVIQSNYAVAIQKMYEAGRDITA